jgi:DNA-binding SARP family transcriptional activator
MRGERDLALHAMDRCIATAEGSGDRWLLAVMMMRRALAFLMLGNHDAAQRDFEASIPRLRAMGEHWFLSLALEGMAMNALARGDVSAAGAYARESVMVLRPEPDMWFISRSVDAIAVILDAQLEDSRAGSGAPDSRAEVAARLMGAASGLRRRCGAGIIGPDVARHASVLESLRARIGAEAFAAAFTQGERLSVDDVFDMMERDPVVSGLAARHAAPEAPAPEVRVAPQRLEISTLGALSITVDGVPMPDESLPTGKVLELLLFLLLHRGATKDEVGLALWPDASPAQVRNLFHVTLHNLRRTMGATRWISYDRSIYRFDRMPDQGHTLEVDVDIVLSASTRVRALVHERAAPPVEVLVDAKHALDRYRGTLAQGLVREDWIIPHQDRVHSAWVEGMDALAQLEFRVGRYDHAASVMEAVLSAEPLRESAHRLYLQTLAARGEPARALAHYERLTELLRREVGTKPAAETRQLAERLRG